MAREFLTAMTYHKDFTMEAYTDYETNELYIKNFYSDLPEGNYVKYTAKDAMDRKDFEAFVEKAVAFIWENGILINDSRFNVDTSYEKWDSEQ